jgi:GR25 family glycosyltransferase involved in LPS biosynthesis
MTKSVEVVVISLLRAAERRRLISEKFTSLSQSWSFFDAHTSLANPALEYDEARIRRTIGRTLSGPELGVWSSHYTVIQRFLNESLNDYLLVFEDDVIFDTAFPVHAVVDICEERGIHYIRLFGMYYADAVWLSFFYDRSIIRYKSTPAGSQAYLISKEGARRLVTGCRAVEATVDLALDSFWKTGLPIYSVFPFPVIERFSPTSIPMQNGGDLNGAERKAFIVNRVRNRLRKILENRKLGATDLQFRQKSLGFKQINAEDQRP